VPEAARDSVFKAFTRLDDSRSRETGGYGLGLAIVARIAALHGGDSVFKAFTRLDDSRSRETGGYGLGLAIVARIAALHGGDASVSESADLGGASFKVRWQPPG
jgi:signal transduction histidine kinase